MTTNQFVSKSQLFERLSEIFAYEESGMLTLLTDSRKSILMRFSEGKLTSARCRSWEIEYTIAALLEAETIKYSYTSSLVEDKPALLPASEFLSRIGFTGAELPIEEEEVVTLEPVEEVPEVISEASDIGNEDQDGKEVDRAIAAKMNYF